MITSIKQHIRHRLFDWALGKYHTTMGWRLAPPYYEYWKNSQKLYSGDGDRFAKEATEFHRNGIVSVQTEDTISVGKIMSEKLVPLLKDPTCWHDKDKTNSVRYTGDALKDFPELRSLFEKTLGPVLESIFKSHFKIFYAVMYRNGNEGWEAIGSQKWHTDGGPGTCINIMFLPEGVTRENGAMEAMPWEISKKLISSCQREITDYLANQSDPVDKWQQREMKCDIFSRDIEAKYQNDIIQPTGEGGMLLFFRNNTVHKGGLPNVGNERIAIVLHAYPSDRPEDLDDLFTNGRNKGDSFPKNPAF